jgi:uroporphyrinogen III methyltransferase/synthase
VGIAGKPHDSTILGAIGPQTLATAEELGLRVDVVAGKPDVLSLVEALADHALALRAAGELPPAARRRKGTKKASARTKR